MDKEQIAKQKAETDFMNAESIATKRELTGHEKWAFICGCLEHKLAKAYLECS